MVTSCKLSSMFGWCPGSPHYHHTPPRQCLREPVAVYLPSADLGWHCHRLQLVLRHMLGPQGYDGHLEGGGESCTKIPLRP